MSQPEGYSHKAIEEKWQKRWEEAQAFQAHEEKGKKKSYLLVEFPYPSGAGLHVGHVRSYTALDIIARKRRAQGESVLYPIGWDAFGLPTENYAVKTGIHPKIVTKENTNTFRRQLKRLGFSFDWEREVDTTDPAYYKWTQWIFLKLFEKGLAYKAKMPINWCLSCKIGLANEEVIDGKCERCGGDTEKRDKEQWMLAITKYADRLDKDLDTVDYWDRIKIQQRNWIGRSEGAEIDFPVAGSEKKITVFTTRPDTLYGATYMVLAPEHLLIQELKPQLLNWEEIYRYVGTAAKRTEIERTAEGKEKTGVELKGVKAINPATKEEIPIYIADYVLAYYGTGAIMAVPAHDERDFAFAKKFNLQIQPVVLSGGSVQMGWSVEAYGEEWNNWYVNPGKLINSAQFDGYKSDEASKKITEHVGGRPKVTYKLRDWVFSRQRYWGEPIPLVHCEKDGWVAVPEKELPVQLPEVQNYQPTDTGESPLAAIEEWVNTACPSCGGSAKRETDTMPNWAGSSWYYLRYADPHNDGAFASEEHLNYWTPVDWYNGGMEHTTLHLLYSRFWHKFLYDQGLVPTPEPYAKRTSHGLILAEGGEKMSKSKGNVVNPDDIADMLGADTLRLYEMFLGPFDQPVSWNPESIAGVRRFLERVFNLKEKVADVSMDDETANIAHQSIVKVSSDIENLKMNTAVSQLMIFSKRLGELEKVPKEAYAILLKLLAPFAPHLSHEIWEGFGHNTLIAQELWPSADPSKIKRDSTQVAVQVNGKVRGTIVLSPEAGEEEAIAAARANKGLEKWLSKKNLAKVVYVPGRILSLSLDL